MTRVTGGFGPMTPTKIAGLALFFAGLAVLLLGRLTPVDRSLLNGVGLVLIGLSFLVDALFPGGSELSDQQTVLMKQAGLPTQPRAVKAFSLIVGAPLLLFGIYLALG